ncbi:hypothetical protein PRIPAC_89534 [Pristionchus pacificus]|uniref:Uncharacterized protein n=1 Tax=Pristionchus pacificus TaxID=54126 RepID=A0A2A6B742_PRIPA|nr:hypothetical protein PRIPAC_89534 [Pristionchus pacificus]|eukprot:PDM61684.1 hypothetical protein PRIPAC_51126 [Pristionchus pacificus]
MEPTRSSFRQQWTSGTPSYREKKDPRTLRVRETLPKPLFVKMAKVEEWKAKFGGAQHVIIQAQHSARIGSLLATIGAKFEVVNYIHKRDNRENLCKYKVSSKTTTMNIPALPTDVIRRVIGYSAHCDHPIAEIQRVSQLWRDLVDEEFDRISNLLQVDEILTSTDRSSAKGFQMILKIRKNGLDFAHRFLHHFGYKKVNKEMSHLRKFVQLNEVRQKRSNDLRALRVVNKVVLKQLSARLNNLPCIFRHIRTEEVHCWSPHVAINQSIIKLLRQWNVSKLHLELADYAPANLSTENNAILDDFLLQLADSVDVLHIQQSKPFQYRKFSYLIGEHDLPIISEMLARRVSKLKIEHDNRAIEADYGSLIALAQARVFPTLHYYRSAINECEISAHAKQYKRTTFISVTFRPVLNAPKSGGAGSCSSTDNGERLPNLDQASYERTRGISWLK